MPVIPVAIAVGSAIGSAAAAVGGAALAVGSAVAGAVGTAATVAGGLLATGVSAVTSTVGALLGAKGVASAVITGGAMTIQAVMQKKAQKKALSASEEQALRLYEQKNRELAAQEYAEIEKQEAIKAEKIRLEKQEKIDRKYLISSAQGQHIETLANLLTAEKSLSSPKRVVPILFSTPPAKTNVSWIDKLNENIHNFFN